MSRTTIELERALPEGVLQIFATAVEDAVAQRYPDAAVKVAFEAPRRPEFGDFATNVAFSLAKVAKRSPQDVAAQIVADARSRAPHLDTLFSSIEPTSGFINLRLAPGI